jgi:hypothetical protein
MGVPFRELDETVIAVGRQKVGKSYWLRRYLWNRKRETGGYMLANDPNLGFYDDRRTIPSRRYTSLEGAHVGLRKYGGTVVHVLDAPITVDQGRDLSIALAAASMAQARAANQKTFAPVFYMVDEAVTSESTTSKKMSPAWLDLIARRRHYGVALGLTMQSVFFAHRVVTSQATRIEVFPIQDPYDVQGLVRLGLRKDLAASLEADPNAGTAAAAPRLEKYEHITIESGVTTAVHSKHLSLHRRDLALPKRGRRAP